MDRDPLEVGDPVTDARRLEPHRTGPRPLPVPVDLDDEATELARVRGGPVDLRRDRLGVPRRDRAEERLDVLVRRERDEERDVVCARPPDPNGAHGVGLAGSGSRRRIRTSPEPRATPPRINASPRTALAVSA